MASNEQRTFIYLNFDIDPFTAELVFPQGVPKGGSVSLVFGAFQKGRSVKTTKFTEEFARMVSQKFRVSSPLIDGSPQCFIRISLVKEGAEPPLIPNPNKTVSLLKKPPVPAETSQQPKRAPPEPQFPVTIDSDDEEENVEEVDDNDVLDENAERDVPERAGPAAVKSVAAVSGASRETASKAAAQKFAESNGSVEDHSDSDESIESRPSSPFDDAGDDAAESTASDAHHARRHLHQKLHCHLCSRIFFIKERFEKHLSAHQENWGFTCPVCGQLFETQGYLENHQLRHSGKTPYECTDCGKRFSAPQGLTFHKQQHHHAKRPRHVGNSRMDHWPLGCDICGIRFKYLSSQQAHMAFHHPSTEGESLQCTYCQLVVKEHNLEMLDADGTEAIEVMDESMIVGEEAIHIVEEDGMEGITEEGGMHIVEEDGIEVVGEGAVQVVGDDGIHFVSHEQAMELISQEGMQVVKGQYIHADVEQDVQLVSDEGAKGGNEVVLLELGEPSVQT
ncbi:hypothetical protein HPB52_019493 [Rhipicephalus sanguineus]|uniref:C2H2-type domain-containing protein n=1 Tax=Rhipicephalus sanguineus TaxID=34632 RepID=A0A9D4TBG4_RHISA|nr:hypothetical protein HPB52_019493 [Rhipicephalus sanguineus]